MKKTSLLSIAYGVIIAMAGTCLCSAQIVLNVGSLTLQSPDSDTPVFVDVTFGPSGSLSLSGYQLALDVSSASTGVSITGAVTPLTSPIFPSGSPFVSETGLRLEATDFLASGAAPISEGLGLLRVQLNIAAGTVGNFGLNIDSDPSLGTILADMDGIAMNFTAQNGLITVTPVPEPLVGGAVGAMLLVGAIIFRRFSKARRLA